jgi:hypothetical protein
MINLENQKGILTMRLSPVSRAVINIVDPTWGLRSRLYALARFAG